MSKTGMDLSFRYNDGGIRTEKTVNGKTTKYHLVGDKVTFETDGENSIYYTYDSNSKLVSMNINGEEYYYIRNAQGDITGLFDKSGNIVVTYVYDSWGQVISVDGSLKDTVGKLNPYRYRGYRYDNETGLYYLQSRYYNPAWGRFINADAIAGVVGEILGHNVFVYCKNNAVNMSDPSGFRPIYTVGEETDAMREASLKTMPGLVNYEWIAKEKTLYIEGEGPKLSLEEMSTFKIQLASGEAGLAKIYNEYRYGQWSLKSPYVTGDIGLESMLVKSSLYGKMSLFTVGGSLYIPVPFTKRKVELGGEVDIFSVGGGVSVDLRKKRLKFGLHLGYGGDIIIQLH